MRNFANCGRLLSRPSLVIEIDRELSSRSLREFVRNAWAVTEPSTPFVEGWHIDAIVEHLEAITNGQNRNLVINVPPRHMKSLLVSVFWPAWEWIRWPERRWLFSSYAAQLSIRDSLKCRRLIDSPWYQGNWGDCFALTSDQNTKGRFDNNRSGYRLSTSVGGAATGEGGDRIICDDPHNVQEAESDAIRKSTLDWWDTVMSTRQNDPKSAAKVVVMQRCHQADLSGHLLAQGGWEHLCLPAEYEGPRQPTSIGWTDPRTKTDELLWPARFGRKEIEDLKRSLGSYATAGQLQQRPAPAGGGIFKRTWWRFYTEIPRNLLGHPRFTEVIQSWDLSFKDNHNSSFVVGQVWGRIGADRYLLDQVRGRFDFVVTLQHLLTLSAKWPSARIKLIESKANGPAVISSLRHRITGLVAVEVRGSKEARAHAISPIVESGNVYLPNPSMAPWVQDFIEEAAAFPNGAADDQVDAMSQALNRIGSFEREIRV
jgi:predicted phage terminase large subunit-like protein